jgi:hypothetical protein
MFSDDGGLTVRIVTARMVPASTMKTAPLNSSINVNLRLSVVSTPHRSYSAVSNMNVLLLTDVSLRGPYW